MLAASLYGQSDNTTIIPCKTTLDYTAYLKHEIKQILNMLGQTENERSKDIMKHHFAKA
jgi:hypothetical protein